MIERGIEVDEIGEESAGCHLACELIEIIVGVFGKIAHTTLFLPYLNGEDGCRAIAYTLIGGTQQFTDDAASLSRSVGAIIDGAEHHLVASTRMDGVHVVNKRLHRLVHPGYGLVDGMVHVTLVTGIFFDIFLDIILDVDIVEV